MESVIRAFVVYLFLLIVFLIISETTQQAMVANDHSMTNGAILILTLVGMDIALSLIKQWVPAAEAWLDGLPIVIVRDGKLLQDRMNRERVDKADILEAARQRLGIATLDEIKYAVLERNGDITIIPRS
jgi:uncharacterized membrane protein YcaP (DUF421 family)